MVTTDRPELPPANAETRTALYGGALFHLAASAASTQLVDEVSTLVRDELGPGDPRFAQASLHEEEFFARIGRIRRRIYTDAAFHELVFGVIAACGFDPGRVAFDPLRLRVVSHLGHEDARAAPIYYAHRDTWFALSQAVIAGWIAMHDIPAEQTFLVYPDWLERPIANTSARFDYGRWSRDGRDLKIGWQDRDAGREVLYSVTTGELARGPTVALAARRAETVLFSGAHLHETRPHAAGHTRFSLDFRMVHLDDHAAGRGPANVDNQSRGAATDDYVRR